MCHAGQLERECHYFKKKLNQMAASQLIIIEVIFLAFLVGYLIKYYKSSTVTTDVVIVTFIAWSLSFAGTILLPYDMAITLSPNSNSNNASMFPLWEAIYWRLHSNLAILFIHFIHLFI